MRRGGLGVGESNTTRPPRSRGIHYLVKYTKRSHDCQDPVTNAHNRGSPVSKATDYCSPGSIWKLAACFLSWTLPEAIIATEGGGLIKSTGWLVYVALQLNLSKTIVRAQPFVFKLCNKQLFIWMHCYGTELCCCVRVNSGRCSFSLRVLVTFKSDLVAWFLSVEASFCFGLTESQFELKSLALCKRIKYS